MDNNIKKESVKPTENDVKNLSENKNIKVVKTTVIDDRMDALYYGNIRLSGGVARNNYPWEDKSLFEENKHKSADNTKVESQYIKNNKEAKYVANTQSDLPKLRTKYKSEPDRLVQVKMDKPVLTKAKPLSTRQYVQNDQYYQPGSGVFPGTGRNVSTDNLTIIERKKLVLKLLKQAGLSKIIVAGIMGNIHKETYTAEEGLGCFNPLSHNKSDTNQYPSLGLVQFNGRWNGNTKDPEKVWDLVGRDIPSQINYILTKWSNWNSFKPYIAQAKDASDAAYLFAAHAEICANCTKGRSVYYGDKTFHAYQRSEFAVSYYKKMNDPSDPLYWESN